MQRRDTAWLWVTWIEAEDRDRQQGPAVNMGPRDTVSVVTDLSGPHLLFPTWATHGRDDTKGLGGKRICKTWKNENNYPSSELGERRHRAHCKRNNSDVTSQREGLGKQVLMDSCVISEGKLSALRCQSSRHSSPGKEFAQGPKGIRVIWPERRGGWGQRQRDRQRYREYVLCLPYWMLHLPIVKDA